MNRLKNIDDAAAYCGVSASTFSREVRPHVPPVRIGERILFDIKALDRWLDEKSGISPNPAPLVAGPYEQRKRRKSAGV